MVNPKYKITNSKIKIREIDGEFYTDGWIGTTHIDRAVEDGYENTMFTRNFWEAAAKAMNGPEDNIDSIGNTRAVSIQHDWIKERDSSKKPIGMAMPGVEVREYEDADGVKDGHYGLWGTTHLNRMHEDFNDTKYNIEHGYYPGYSIEFQEGEWKGVNIAGRAVKVIDSFKEWLGYAYAGARLIANPKAIITSFGYREVEEALKNKLLEENNMSKEKIDVLIREIGEINSEVKPEDLEGKTEEELVAVKAEEQVKVDEAQERESKLKVLEEAKIREIAEAKVKEEIDAKIEAGVKLREADIKKGIKVEDMVASIRESEEYKNALGAIEVKTRVAKQSKGDNQMESINYRMMKDSLEKQNYAQFRNAARGYAEEHDIVKKAFADPASYVEQGLMKNSTLKVRTEGKGLHVFGDIQIRSTLDTGSNPEGTYGQQGAEFSDVYMPGLIDTFNNQRNYLGFLEKEEHVDGGEYVGWILITSQNKDANTVHVDFDKVTVEKSYSSKEKIRSPLKIARVGISVADTTLRYSSRNLGDLFQRELDTGMNYMMNDIDSKLFAETQDGAGNNPLGLEAVADTTGNTTIYGKVRSTTNRLTTGTLADTYNAVGGALTETLLRAGLTKIETRGSNLGRVAIVTSPKGKNFLFNLLDGNRRFGTTQAEFGFNQMTVASYDGIPIITDHNCNSTAATAAAASACLFFVDRDQNKIVIGMEPRITNLAKVGAATEAYLEMDYAHVYKDPTRIYMLDTFTTG